MEIRYRNQNGSELALSSAPGVRLVKIDGLSPASVINTSATSGFDGATYISAQAPMRNIVMELDIRSEDDRLRLYDIFRIKQWGTFFYTSPLRSVKIECLTESVEAPVTLAPLKAQISLLCPQPYFESVDVLRRDIAEVVASWEFPWEIPMEGTELSYKSQSLLVSAPNPSETDVGMTIVFYANSALSNPSVLNVQTGEYMRLETAMLAGDVITVNTRRGQKAITRTRDYVTANLFNARSAGSTFLQLHQGDNIIRYDADSNLTGLEVTFYYTELYAGV